MTFTTEAKYNGGEIRAKADAKGECILGEYKGKEIILAKTIGASDTSPYLFTDSQDRLWLFWNTLLADSLESSQIKFRIAENADDEINWTWQDAMYVRMGGCFRDSHFNSGIDPENEPFGKALIKRFNELRACGEVDVSDEEWAEFITEKEKMCDGSMLGFIDYTGIYPHTRRFGWCVVGAPIENEGTIYLPIYSYPLQSALIASCSNQRDWDFSEPVIGFGKKVKELTLKKDGNVFTLSEGNKTAVSKDLYEWTLALSDITNPEETLKSNSTEFDHNCNYGVISWETDEKYSDKSENTETFAEMRAKNKDWHITVPGLEEYSAPVTEDIFPLINEHAHGSGIVQLPDGELFAVWFQGDGERRAADGRVLAARKPVGQGWTEPFILANTKGIADINPCIFVDDQERLWFFWYPVISTDWETSQTKYKYAEKGHYLYADGYETEPDWDWQEIMYPTPCEDFRGQAIGFDNGEYIYGEKCGVPQYITEEQFKEHPLPDSEFVKIDDKYFTDSFVVELTRGMVNAANFIKENNFYGDDTEKLADELLTELPPRCRVGVGADNEYNRYNPIDRVICWQTKNKPLQFNYNGKSRIMLPLYCDKFDCSMVGYTDDYGKTWEYSQPVSSTGNIQAATVQMNDGTLRSYFRSSVPYETLAYQESKDGGKTWGTCGIEFSMTHEGGFDIVKLKSGKWVMSISENIIDGDKKYPRARLCLSVSDDEGKTWKKTPIEEDVTGASQYHYSAIIEGIDGNIYVVYSHDNKNDGLNRNNIRMTRLELK